MLYIGKFDRENFKPITKDINPNTGILLKEIKEDDKIFQLILRLHISKDNYMYKNSILIKENINKICNKQLF